MKKFFSSIYRALITHMPGPAGRRVRYLYYRRKFKKCGKNVLIDEGVLIENPKWISLGDDVWIDKQSVLIAGPVDLTGQIVKRKENESFPGLEGELIIDNCVHIGINNIIQAHAGVYIGEDVTTSPGVKIYSLSNTPSDADNPGVITYANYLVKEKPVTYRVSPIVIEDGVWIAINSVVLGATIGKYSFIAANSLVMSDISKNSYASGFPAKRIRDRFRLDKV